MIRPPRGVWSFIIRIACCVHRKAPVRLMSTTFFHCSTVSSSRLTAGAPTPALLNRRSRRPKALSRCANSARTDAGSLTSVGDGQRDAGRDAGFRDRLLERLAPPSGQGDAIAVLQQRDRDGLADAGAGAGDDGDFRRGSHGCEGPRVEWGRDCGREPRGRQTPRRTSRGRRAARRAGRRAGAGCQDVTRLVGSNAGGRKSPAGRRPRKMSPFRRSARRRAGRPSLRKGSQRVCTIADHPHRAAPRRRRRRAGQEAHREGGRPAALHLQGRRQARRRRPRRREVRARSRASCAATPSRCSRSTTSPTRRSCASCSACSCGSTYLEGRYDDALKARRADPRARGQARGQAAVGHVDARDDRGASARSATRTSDAYRARGRRA